jgi:hypothetical protein
MNFEKDFEVFASPFEKHAVKYLIINDMWRPSKDTLDKPLFRYTDKYYLPGYY